MRDPRHRPPRPARHAARARTHWSTRIAALLIGTLAARAAEAQPGRYEFSELHMGLRVRMVVYAPDDSVARHAVRSAYGRIAALEDILSDWRPSSELRRLSAVPAGSRAPLGRELCTVLDAALELARRSGGAFDPTVGPLVALWRESRRTALLPSDEALAHARSRVGWQRVRLDAADCTVAFDVEGMQLDLGGIAKGYILDEARRALEANGVPRALIEAGGDIVVGDAPPGRAGWLITVPHEDPMLTERAGSLVRAAIATSGDTEQSVTIGGVRYSHVIDPRTGLGLTNGATATVIARDGMTADALATLLTVLGEDGGGLLAAYPGSVGRVMVTRRSVP